MVATLEDGPAPRGYGRTDWPGPHADAFALPARRYAVLHVGASTPLKRWPADRWHRLAQWLESRGVEAVWSSGRGEEPIVRECDPAARWRSYAGTLSLAQIWRLLADAALLVAPDTGIAHLGRVVGTPTVTLFGPGSAAISGAGSFWKDAPFRAVTIEAFPCRDQRVLFKREIEWVRRCGRSITECPHPRCMDAIEIDRVIAAIADLGIAPR